MDTYNKGKEEEERGSAWMWRSGIRRKEKELISGILGGARMMMITRGKTRRSRLAMGRTEEEEDKRMGTNEEEEEEEDRGVVRM